MSFRSLALGAAALIALSTTQPAAAQTLTSLPYKDSNSTVQNQAVYSDGTRIFPAHMCYGWTGSAPKACAVDASGNLGVQDAGGSLTVDTGTPGQFVITSSTLPTGASTAALQTAGNATLASILSTGIPITSQPLPSGAATATGVAAVVTALGSPLQAGGSVGISGAANIATGQITATTTSGVLVAARTGRRTLTLVNSSTTPVYVGPSGVTTSTGFLVPGVAGASLTLTFAGALYGVTASGTAALAEYELY